MFGYLVADISTLTEEQALRYKACYCGLCRCLGQRHGQLSRLSLNYDMTFLILLLSSLYEPEEERGENRCIRHPIKPQPWNRNEISSYAADINLILAYLKCLDDWQDERSLPALLASKFLQPSYEQLQQLYPRQCVGIEQAMKELREIEKSGLPQPDAAAACFGRLMAEVFVWKEDRWQRDLRSMAQALGSFIYLMDAVMDLEEDKQRGRYNPLLDYHDLEDKQARFSDILKMELGECIYHFDKLPLVQDGDILKNILCCGLWAQFNNKYRKNHSRKEET